MKGLPPYSCTLLRMFIPLGETLFATEIVSEYIKTFIFPSEGSVIRKSKPYFHGCRFEIVFLPSKMDFEFMGESQGADFEVFNILGVQRIKRVLYIRGFTHAFCLEMQIGGRPEDRGSQRLRKRVRSLQAKKEKLLLLSVGPRL